MRNLKKVIALVAVFAMLISSVAFADTFSDVAATDNYAEAIETLSALDIITGDDENNDGKMEFRPADTITRAEVTAIISRIQGMNSAAQSNTEFVDVPSSHWASGYINQAAGQGIVNGYGDGNFGPEDAVKYEEIIKMLMETLGYNPFVNDNGGYPTGYITAAQRYGVLEGVVGGGVGTEAPRGMVAQMVYNAIDTPLMDKYTYGKDAQYVVYDNIDTYGYTTLLTRDLKMVKLTGKVVANSYTDLVSGSTDVDTSMDKTIALRVDNTNSNYQYGFEDYLYTADNDRSLTLYQGDVDADPYLGYAVSLYAREESNNDEYTLVSITQNGSRNSSVSFTLDQFSKFEEGTSGKSTLRYYKNLNDSNDTRLNIQADPTVIYNGVAAAEDLKDYFTDGVIEEDTLYSGKVTVMDTDDISGYDVVIIEIGAGAVVSDVNANGRVNFYQAAEYPAIGKGKSSLNRLDFDEEDTNVLINLTKNGEPYDFKELKEWDVLTVIWNGTDDVYNVRVLAEENSIVSSIKSTRPTNVDGEYEYNIDGTWYKAANNAYYTGSKLEAGTSGKFYIDEYGKIIALDKRVQPENAVGVPSDNYAYILNAAPETDAWNKANVRVQLLAKTGEVFEAYLYANATVMNPSDAVIDAVGGEKGTDKLTVKAEDLTTDQADDLCKALINQMVTYAGNSNGEIRTIKMAMANGSDDFSYATRTPVMTNVDYDEENLTMGKVMITEETFVFFIDGENKITFGDSAVTADKDRSSVVSGKALAEDTYEEVVAFVDDANSEYASALVIMNRDGGTSPASNVAVIDSVGESATSDSDTVYSVDFYLNGELMTATTKVDMTNEDVVASAKRGDVFKFTLEGDTITNATPYLVFDRASNGRPFEMNSLKTPKLTALKGNKANSDEEVYFGAVSNIPRGSRNVTITLMDKDGVVADADDTQIIKTSTDTNVYVYNSNVNDKYALETGSLGDAELQDKDLASLDENGEPMKVEGDSKYIEDGTVTPAYGMMDYIFARYYNNRAADIVIYKNYDFGRFSVVPAK